MTIWFANPSHLRVALNFPEDENIFINHICQSSEIPSPEKGDLCWKGWNRWNEYQCNPWTPKPIILPVLATMTFFCVYLLRLSPVCVFIKLLFFRHPPAAAPSTNGPPADASENGQKEETAEEPKVPFPACPFCLCLFVYCSPAFFEDIKREPKCYVGVL